MRNKFNHKPARPKSSGTPTKNIVQKMYSNKIQEKASILIPTSERLPKKQLDHKVAAVSSMSYSSRQIAPTDLDLLVPPFPPGDENIPH